MLKFQIYTEELHGFSDYHLVVDLSLAPSSLTPYVPLG